MATLTFDCTNASSPFFIENKKERDYMAYHDGVLYVAQEYGKGSEFANYLKKIQASIKVLPKIEQMPLLDFKKKFGDLRYDDVSNDNSTTQEDVIKIIGSATKEKASDLHILTSRSDGVTYFKFRIDGDLESKNAITLQKGEALHSTIYSTMCAAGAEPMLNPLRSQDARMKEEYVSSLGLSGVRIATRPTDDGLLMAMRLLYRQAATAKTLVELGYTKQQETDIWSIADKPYGMMLLTGGTGSGKSTTIERLLSGLSVKHQGKKHIITAEDPPEYKIKGAVQTAINCDKADPGAIAEAWSSAISNMMRLDPDIILIGETRDKDSAMGAIRAAMTGHFVFTTVHVNDAIGSLQRLADLGVTESFLYDPKIISGLVNQSLTKRLCDHCKIPFIGNEHLVDDALKARILRFTDPQKVFLAKEDGCPNCRKGFVGREAVAEVVRTTAELLNKYREHGKLAATRYWVEEMNGMTKCQCMTLKINSGILDPRAAETDVCALDQDENDLGIVRIPQLKVASVG